MSGKVTTTSAGKTRPRPPAGKGKVPTAAAVRAAAFGCADLVAAAVALGVGDVAKLLAGRKRLAAAWDRGRLLRRVADVAGTTVVVPERADKALGLPKGSFAKLYSRDRVVRELWDKGRCAIYVAIERALVERVKEGEPKAIAAVEHLFGPREAVGPCDFRRLRPTAMEQATGFARQQILRWHKDNGLPRNADGTYSLPAFVAWHAKWERDKLSGGSSAAGLNPMQAEKARLLKMQADENEGRLIDRNEVIAMLRVRAAWLVQLLSEPRADEWAHAHEGLTAAQLKAAYCDAFSALRRQWCRFPEAVPVPEAAKEKFEEALQLLCDGADNVTR